MRRTTTSRIPATILAAGIVALPFKTLAAAPPDSTVPDTTIPDEGTIDDGTIDVIEDVLDVEFGDEVLDLLDDAFDSGVLADDLVVITDHAAWEDLSARIETQIAEQTLTWSVVGELWTAVFDQVVADAAACGDDPTCLTVDQATIIASYSQMLIANYDELIARLETLSPEQAALLAAELDEAMAMTAQKLAVFAAVGATGNVDADDLEDLLEDIAELGEDAIEDAFD
ncbi:MAG: hypothetical protein ACO3WU_09530, partial [Ilumatobacteraceae bacterium]